MSESVRGVVLTGLPGSGKSAVGRCVAEVLSRPFLDLDAEIQRRTGRAPADHISHDGEQAFRDLERDAVERACAVGGAVIAAGGGATLDPLNRWAFMQHGLRVRLDVPLDVLARRLADDGVARPLLGEEVQAGLERTAQERAAVYAAADVAVEGDADPAAVADEIVTAAERFDPAATWRVLLDHAYPRHHPAGPPAGRLVIGAGLTKAAFDESVAPFADRPPVVVADSRALAALARLDAALPDERRLSLRGGESAKSFARLGELLRWLADLRVERGDPLVAVGGGTIGDLAGLAAALHRRGMPLIHVPTTWLAQADSAIGGKVAVDLPGAKNGVGTVWPGWSVISDLGLLDTLPLRHRRDGMVECLKAGLIGDPALWALVERRGTGALEGTDPAAVHAIIERAVRVKLAIVDRDPYEEGERRVLNLGHTIGHALEVESRYRLAHGAAVALGLRAVAAIGDRRGAEPGLGEQIDAVLDALGLPLRRAFDARAIEAALGSDKKRSHGRQRWILPLAVGRVQEADDVTADELVTALRAIQP